MFILLGTGPAYVLQQDDTPKIQPTKIHIVNNFLSSLRLLPNLARSAGLYNNPV